MRIIAMMLLVTITASCSPTKDPPKVRISTAEDPAIEIIANAFFASGSRFIIVNEDHSIDWHRHVSACILDQIAQAQPTIFGAEAYHEHKVVNANFATPSGYADEPLFQHIWSVTRYYDLPVFGYDVKWKIEDATSPSKTLFSDAELIERGLKVRDVNRRDRKAAENILRLISDYANYTVYLHVGFQHASEVWRENEEGGEGWLAAHLARLTGENPMTVYQMGPERFARYLKQDRVETDLGKCALMDQAVPVLRTGKGQVGCIERRRNGLGMGSDYIIADAANGVDPVDIAKIALCDVH